jgi:hypothetical protein
VFAHNADDILSLVALLGLFGRIFDQPAEHAHCVDSVGLLRLYAQNGLAHEAADWCRAALDGVPPVERRALLWELAVLLRRRGDREGAAAVWTELAREAGAYAVPAQVELAKYYEHHERNYLAATRATEAALAALAVARFPVPPAQRRDLERRLGRLYFRLRRQDGARTPDRVADQGLSANGVCRTAS